MAATRSFLEPPKMLGGENIVTYLIPSNGIDCHLQDTVGEKRRWHKIVLWEPTHGRRKRWRHAKTYIQILEEDTHMSTEELKTKMEDRDGWRRFVKLSRVHPDYVSK